MAKKDSTDQQDAPATERLSLHPLSLEEALRGAMETGPPPKLRKGQKKKAKKSKRGHGKRSE